jgi:hypothetical protein
MKLRAAHDVHGVRHAHDALSSESILNSELKFEILKLGYNELGYNELSVIANKK